MIIDISISKIIELVDTEIQWNYDIYFLINFSNVVNWQVIIIINGNDEEILLGTLLP